MEQSA
jgi:hypothetical protein